MARLTPLRDGEPAALQIRDQVRGLILTAQLGGQERLPSVRQLAGDLGVAPGTVAKAYRALEEEGWVTTRIGSGTRVSPGATRTSAETVGRARALVENAAREGIGLEETLRVVAAVWSGGD